MNAPRKVSRNALTMIFIAGCFFVLSAIQLQLNPYPALASDSVAYFTVASDIARLGDINARFYYLEALVEGPFPQKEPHFPGYHLTLAGFFKIFGVSERLAKIFNHALFAASLVPFYLICRRLTNRDALATVLATLMYMMYPTINKNFIMTEVTVIFSNLLVIYLIFNRASEKPNLSTSLLSSCAFIYAILVRPNAIFLAPAILLTFRQRRYWVWLGTSAVVCGAITAVILDSGLLANSQLAPNSFLTYLSKTSDASQRIALIVSNITNNLRYFYITDKSDWHGLSLVLFLSLCVLACLGAWLPKTTQRSFVRFVLIYLMTNMLALFSLYEIGDWRFLRSSIQFVPLVLIALVLILRAYLGAKTSGAIFVSILFFLAAISPGFHSQFQSWQESEQRKAEDNRLLYNDVMDRRDEPYFVISNVDYPRFIIDYPTSYAAVFQDFQIFDKSLAKVLQVYPASHIILTGPVPEATETLMKNMGFEVIRRRKGLSFYKRFSG